MDYDVLCLTETNFDEDLTVKSSTPVTEWSVGIGWLNAYLLYADDVKIYNKINNTLDCDALQSDLIKCYTRLATKCFSMFINALLFYCVIFCYLNINNKASQDIFQL